MRAFCFAAGDLDAPLRPVVPCLGIEFDAKAPLDPVPVPAFFAEVNVASELPAYGQPALPPVGVRAGTYAHFFDTALPILLGNEVSSDLRATIRRILSSMPPLSTLRHVGVMFSRDDVVRLCLAFPSVPATYRFLEAMEWPGAVDTLRAQATSLLRQAARITLTLDVGNGIGPRIGFECRMQNPARIVSGVNEAITAWRPFLSALRDRKLCTASDQEACESWIRSRRIPGVHTRYGALITNLNHVKLNYRPGYPLNAKVYLYAYHIDLHRGAETRMTRSR